MCVVVIDDNMMMMMSKRRKNAREGVKSKEQTHKYQNTHTFYMTDDKRNPPRYNLNKYFLYTYKNSLLSDGWMYMRDVMR